MRTFLGWASLLMLGAFGCSSPHDAPQERIGGVSPELIGGDAGVAPFTSVLDIQNGCTAVMIGPNQILTAAHCVVDIDYEAGLPMKTTIRSRYAPGAFIQVANASSITSDTGWFSSAIVSVDVHPSYLSTCSGGCQYTFSLHPPFPPDLAVITIATHFPACFGLPALFVSPQFGDKVEEVGYGCEDHLGGNRPSPPRFKIAEDTLLDPSDWEVPLSFPVTDVAAFSENYVITRGVMSGGQASLCPGDSGGPLFRGSLTNGGYVAGINAYYTFPTPDHGISEINVFARVDSTATRAWLDSVKAAHPATAAEEERGQSINEGSDPIASVIPLSTVRIETDGTDGCTGVILSATKLLTAAHCKIDDSTEILFYPTTDGAGASPAHLYPSSMIASVTRPTGVLCDPSVDGSFPTTCYAERDSASSSEPVYADFAVVQLTGAVPDGYFPVVLGASGSYASRSTETMWQAGTGDGSMQWGPVYDSTSSDDTGSFATTSFYGLRGDSGGPVFRYAAGTASADGGDGGAPPPLELVGIASDIGPCAATCPAACDAHRDSFSSAVQASNFAWLVAHGGSPVPATSSFGAAK
jgi:V8-like Glu-specific endopeptidase